MDGAVRTLVLGLALLLGACAHPIVITPNLGEPPRAANPSERSVAYVVTQADRDKEVTTPGGGGDQVRYFPYRDLESGLFQVLNSIYSRVTLVRSPGDTEALDRNKVSLVFVPSISTASSSSGALTWPPTDFTVIITYAVQDMTGKPVYRGSVVGRGAATYAEFSSDLPLAGKRAAQDALTQFKRQVEAAAELR